MTIVRYEPFSLVDRFNRELNQLFGLAPLAQHTGADAETRWSPSVDVRESAEQYTVQADLPGVDAKNIEVTADDGVLTIKGERRFEKRDETDGYERLERAAGVFLRRLSLPENALADQIKARHNNGVLEVIIPKRVAPAPKRVNVEVH